VLRLQRLFGRGDLLEVLGKMCENHDKFVGRKKMQFLLVSAAIQDEKDQVRDDSSAGGGWRIFACVENTMNTINANKLLRNSVLCGDK